MLASGALRYPDATLDLDDLFLFEARRRVYKDRTVSLNGRVYEVDTLLVGQKVTLRYDPEAPPSRPLDVVHDGKPAGKATHAYANTAVRRTHNTKQIEPGDPAPEPPPSPLAMRKFREKD
ncbi:MAG: Mu transposase C-terminal domain-containing protein [Alphaproteobacteria bacterium]|nr:Mu transposase C-terminal domain-containing protein [Alphaproteobacteria bacterium]MCY4230602.1 Mu transposase C-terminal domain-containing protein [Alphaproteobacteria bacterium]MCY4318175.1 Mu transposase C-terminal domain-containing protein [Alphaproteobacteria bacterium]